MDKKRKRTRPPVNLIEQEQKTWRHYIKEDLKTLWHYRVCLLPFLASLMVFLFMIFQPISARWEVNGTNHKAVEIDSLLKTRSDFDLKFKNALETPTQDNGVNDPGLKIENKRYTVNDWKSAVSATGLVVWRYTSGLIAIALICGIFIAGYVIWNAFRGFSNTERWVTAIYLFLFCAFLFAMVGFGFNSIEKTTRLMRQFVGNIDAQLSGANLVGKEIFLTYIGYVAAIYILLASSLNLIPFRRTYKKTSHAGDVRDEAQGQLEEAQQEQNNEEEARHLSAQIRYLNMLLYIGAVVLAITVLRQKLMLRWSLDYLPPLSIFADKSPDLLAAKLIYERLDVIVSHIATSVGILNTLLLAAIYVPSALVLQKRARDLSLKAISHERTHQASSEETEGKKSKGEEKKTPPGEDEWMKAHGLTFPLKEQLPRIAAILSPMLAGPISELLVFFKS